ncbi:MAG: hypothetical protein H6617_10995 [Bdellovibrionaceae bacterium]|nr:hypothetical protein [Bdellovibrionales bacterium]MCB9255198.1 hypothetical protein [Pseudobdellovibrionaceae bacterium]
MTRFVLGLLFVSIAAHAAHLDIAECENESDREKCYATVLDTKLSLLLRKNGHGGEETLQEIAFYWGKDCTKDIMGIGFAPTRLTATNLGAAQQACDKIASDVARFGRTGYVDSYKIGSKCTNPDPRPDKNDKTAISRLCLSGIAN